MRLVVPRSEVVTDDAGWTWLQPAQRSTRVRHTTGTFFLALVCTSRTVAARPRWAGRRFAASAARRRLALVEAEAGRRQLAPVALPDGAGFTSSSS